MKWFININTIEELKKRFRELAKQHHPDAGGREEDMKEINLEFEKMFARIEKNGGSNQSHSVNDGYREVINKVINLDGLNIEICGSWIWVSGNTYPHKNAIKEAGFFWASNKKMWYWRPEEERSFNRKHMSMDEIRSLHGSEVVKGSVRQALAGK